MMNLKRLHSRFMFRFAMLLLVLGLAVIPAAPGKGLAFAFPQPAMATLHVIKHVINDNGSLGTASLFTLHVKDSSGNEVAGSPAPGAESPGTTYTLPPGVYTVSENNSTLYGLTYSGQFDSFGGNVVTLNAGDNKTVTLTNDDYDTFEGNPPATLHVIKHVINDDGGTGTAGNFTFHVTSLTGHDVVGSPAQGAESPGVTFSLIQGTYLVSEDNPSGYTVSYSGDLDLNGHIVLKPGDAKTVTITNNDVAVPPPPLPTKATLYVIKHVVNSNGGTGAAGDFSLHVLNSSGTDVAGSPAPGQESPGTTYTLDPGTYTVTEDAHSGYTASYSGDLNANRQVVLDAGVVKTVTITNNDVAVPPPPPPAKATLYVIKHVVNSNGGTGAAGDFSLHVLNNSGTDVAGSPAPGQESPGTTYTLDPGTYTVTESVYGNYTPSYSGDADSSGRVVLEPGDSKTVTVTNDDNPAEPPVIKQLPESVHIDYSYAYINGYDTGGVGPLDSLTREQVSASIYRILKQAGKTTGYIKPTVSDFQDLETDRWSYAAIEYMVSIGAIPKSSSVYPEQPVTRGEMAKIIAMSSGLTDNRSVVSFPDLPPSHPDFNYMNMLVNTGLLVGYPDGTIHPDEPITRAEYITMINRFIRRDNHYNVEGRPTLYNDLEPGYWAFDDIQRSSFGFYPTPDGNGIYQVDPNIGISKADLDN